MIINEHDTRPLSFITDNDKAFLPIISFATSSDPNTLEHALFNYLLKTPIPFYILHPAPVLGFSIHHHDQTGFQQTRFSYPEKLYLDPFLYQNKNAVNEKLQQMETTIQSIEKTSKTLADFSAQNVRLYLYCLNTTNLVW